MRIIILKETNKPYSRRTFKPGDNITVLREYGNELIRAKKAAEIPEAINRVWHFRGVPTTKMRRFWKPRVTLEEYKEYKKEEKN